MHFISPSRKIAKHEWRIVVKDSSRGFGRVTDFEWMDSAGDWKPQCEWPSYDHNDGCFAGCPKGLRNIWAEFRDDIEYALDGRGGKALEKGVSLFNQMQEAPRR